MKLLNILARFRKSESGASMVEYGVALLVVTAIGVAAMATLGGAWSRPRWMTPARSRRRPDHLLTTSRRRHRHRGGAVSTVLLATACC